MPLTYGILGTYPPTQCGLASFSAALLAALRSAEDHPAVVSIVDAAEVAAAPDVAHQWVRSQRGGAAAAAAHLNTFDVAVIQHEYGIFPGRDGAEVLEVVRALRVPTLTVLHTVLTTPSRHQRVILEELCRRSDAVVTMTHTARERLVAHYPVDPVKVWVIPHGAVDNRSGGDTTGRARSAPVVLTWGLLGEGKGIEWAIDAMALLGDLNPAPEYHIVGQTHPRVVERFGEVYRAGLVERAAQRGVTDVVHFDARYLSRDELDGLVRQADVVLLPYDSREQVTSGVLIEAVTAGKPVVSTGFPHARELLASGAGIVVDRQDPAGIAAALRRVLTEPGLSAAMSAEADRITPDLLWPAVADRYRRLAADAVGSGRTSAGLLASA